MKTQTTLSTSAIRHAREVLAGLSDFIGKCQRIVLSEGLSGEEGEYFAAKIHEIAARVANMPTTGQTDGQGKNAVAVLRYFAGGTATWYITEKDMGDGSADTAQHQAFGLADLGYGAELGYISIAEILEAGGEIDFHFTPRTLAEVQGVKPAADTRDARQDQFSKNLEALVKSITEKATQQFLYNENTNIPQKILHSQESVSHAIKQGLVSAISQMHEYTINPQVEFCVDLLEDVNAHQEAAKLSTTLQPA